jgi:hypothetical protein
MVRKANAQTKLEELLQIWWVRIATALLFLGLTYGFFSWAIDSGSLLHYTVAFVFLYFGIVHFVRAVRLVLAR